MFEGLHLLGTPQEGIALQTKLGSDIRNSQAGPPNAFALSSYATLRSKHPAWEERRGPTGVYNCHGLVWASRRTSIYEDEVVGQILKDDGYRLLPEDVAPMPGDVFLYRSTTGSGVLHTGIFLGLKYIKEGQGDGIPQVLSKLNDSLGEVVHAVNDWPYSWQCIEYKVEVWTDR